MAGSITALSNNGIASGNQAVSKSGSDRQVQKEVGDLGKALKNNDVVAAQTAVDSLKSAAPTQNSRTDFNNAVKALDQALKSNNTRGAAEAFASLQQAQKQLQRQREGGPARDVPQRPNVLGATDAPAPQKSTATAVLQKANEATKRHEEVDKSFITRQDLAAKAADTPKPVQTGKTINTTA